MGIYLPNHHHQPGSDTANTMMTSLQLSPAKKNKRKLLEPKRLAADQEPAAVGVDCGLDEDVTEPKRRRGRLNSTGSSETARSPTSLSLYDPIIQCCESPLSPPATPKPASKEESAAHLMAPKKRFKLDALKDMERCDPAKCDAAGINGRLLDGSKGETFQTTDNDVVETAKRSPSTVKRSLNPFRPWGEDDPARAAEGKDDLTDCQRSRPESNGLSEAPTTSIKAESSTPVNPYLSLLMPSLMSVSDPRLAAGAMLPLLSSLGLAAYPGPVMPFLGLTPSLHSPPVQEEPLSLVKPKSPEKPADKDSNDVAHSVVGSPATKSVVKKRAGHVTDNKRLSATKSLPCTDGDSASGDESRPGANGSKQRNYKNLTRERRVEANARERQRVHTITAAFDTLQAALPTEEENPKMSKLSVIKIATAYIMALSRMAGYDYTEDQSAPSVQEVIRHCQDVIHMETKTKKRGS